MLIFLMPLLILANSWRHQLINIFFFFDAAVRFWGRGVGGLVDVDFKSIAAVREGGGELLDVVVEKIDGFGIR